jgi:elongator complex protein 2
VLKDHKGSVQCLAATKDLLATGSTDGTVNIYVLKVTATSNRCELLHQTLQTAPQYPLTLALHAASEGFILAIGGSSSHIHIYVSPRDPLHFQKAAVLKGHEDWIRGLDFTSLKQSPDIYLASASQDRYIRLWKISHAITSTSQTNDLDALYSLTFGTHN